MIGDRGLMPRHDDSGASNVGGLKAVVTAVLAAGSLVGCGNGFCDKHSCIDNFDNGQGSIVQCSDGMWSHSGGRPGACGDHGGEK